MVSICVCFPKQVHIIESDVYPSGPGTDLKSDFVFRLLLRAKDKNESIMETNSTMDYADTTRYISDYV